MPPTGLDDATRNGSATRASSRSGRPTDCMSLPFSSHPLYQLRKFIIIIAILGAILCFSGVSWYGYFGGALSSGCTLLAISAFYSLLDLLCYARRKKDNPDDEPDRPKGKWALFDLIMAILLQLSFWPSIVDLMDTYIYYYTNLPGAYGALAALVCSILHAWCFWKQLIEHNKQMWLSSLEPQPCARCGYVEEREETTTTRDPPSQDERPNLFPYAGPSADFGRANILTPDSPESAMEEGLLIGSDFGSSYGSVERTEPVLEPPEEIIVGKGKKKAKRSSSQKSSVRESIS